VAAAGAVLTTFMHSVEVDYLFITLLLFLYLEKGGFEYDPG